MKRLAMLFIQIFFVGLLFGVDYSFFKDGNSTDRDYFTGQRFDTFIYYENLQNKEKIRCIEDDNMKIQNNGNDGFPLEKEKIERWKDKYFYNEKGQLIKEETNFHDGHRTEYIYNENGYYLGAGLNNKKYVYVSENERIYNNRIRQTIENSGEEYTVITDDMESRVGDKKTVYKYDGKQIIRFEETSYNWRREESFITTYDFEYDTDNKLKKVIHHGIDLPDKIEVGNNITIFEYDENNHIKKIIETDLKRPEESRISEFSDYDEYGNWHSRKVYRQDKLYNETKRIIEYRK